MKDTEQIKQIQEVNLDKGRVWFFQKVSWLAAFAFLFSGFLYLSLGSGKILNTYISLANGGSTMLSLGLGTLLVGLLLFNTIAGIYHRRKGRHKRFIHSFASVIVPTTLGVIFYTVNMFLNPVWLDYLFWFSIATNVSMLVTSIVAASFFYESTGKYALVIPAVFLLTLGFFSSVHYLNAEDMANSLQTEYSATGEYEENLRKTASVLPPLDDTAALLVASDHAERTFSSTNPAVSEAVTQPTSVCGGTFRNIREYGVDHPKASTFLLWRESVRRAIDANSSSTINLDLERKRYELMSDFANYNDPSESVVVNSCDTEAKHYGVNVEGISCSTGLLVQAQNTGDREVNEVMVTANPVDGSEQGQRSTIDQTWTKDLRVIDVPQMRFTEGKTYRIDLTLNQDFTIPIYCEGGNGFAETP